MSRSETKKWRDATTGARARYYTTVSIFCDSYHVDGIGAYPEALADLLDGSLSFLA